MQCQDHKNTAHLYLIFIVAIVPHMHIILFLVLAVVFSINCNLIIVGMGLFPVSWSPCYVFFSNPVGSFKVRIDFQQMSLFLPKFSINIRATADLFLFVLGEKVESNLTYA